MAIPFRTLRFKRGTTQWRVNFVRIDYKRNEKSSWIPIPRNFSEQLSSLAFTGILHWEAPLKKTGKNISLIPYLTGGTTREFSPRNVDNHFNAGTDAKVAVSSSLNLDLTVNPDFSQVEVDRQVTNLSRFELFFPERRQFFVENSDLFSSYGAESINPFFSRRIGVGRDPYTGQFRQNPILYGARLSGKVSQDWRLGLLNVQTAADPSIDLASTNYTVAAVQRRVFSRSNLGAILVNKQVLRDDSSGEFSLFSGHYNRIAGLDYTLASKDNRWNGKIFFHQAFLPHQPPNAFAHAAFLEYNATHLRFTWNHELVGENYGAETGFVPRQGYWRWEPEVSYYFFPKRSRLVNNYGLVAGGDVFVDKKNNKPLDGDMDYGVVINFQNTSVLRAFYRFDYVYLFSPFDPTNTQGPELAKGSYYRYHSVRLRYQSDIRKLFNVNTFLRIGAYFNGKIISASGAINYRIQPHGAVSLDYSLNRISLPSPYHSGNLILLGPSIDWAFTRTIFFKAVFQYNNQIKNFNTNLRFQWRYRPVSDFFIVYSDNYKDSFVVRNRGVVVKLTHWFNL